MKPFFRFFYIRILACIFMLVTALLFVIAAAIALISPIRALLILGKPMRDFVAKAERYAELWGKIR